MKVVVVVKKKTHVEKKKQIEEQEQEKEEQEETKNKKKEEDKDAELDTTHDDDGLPSYLKNDAKKKIEVLMYASKCKRREQIVQEFRDNDVDIMWVTDLHGSELRKLIVDAKIVINVHFYDASALELSRCIPAIAHGALVVSEPSKDADIDTMYGDMIIFTEVTRMVAKCLEYLRGRGADARHLSFTRSAYQNLCLNFSQTSLFMRSGAHLDILEWFKFTFILDESTRISLEAANAVSSLSSVSIPSSSPPISDCKSISSSSPSSSSSLLSPSSSSSVHSSPNYAYTREFVNKITEDAQLREIAIHEPAPEAIKERTYVDIAHYYKSTPLSDTVVPVILSSSTKRNKKKKEKQKQKQKQKKVNSANNEKENGKNENENEEKEKEKENDDGDGDGDDSTSKETKETKEEEEDEDEKNKRTTATATTATATIGEKETKEICMGLQLSHLTHMFASVRRITTSLLQEKVRWAIDALLPVWKVKVMLRKPDEACVCFVKALCMYVAPEFPFSKKSSGSASGSDSVVSDSISDRVAKNTKLTHVLEQKRIDMVFEKVTGQSSKSLFSSRFFFFVQRSDANNAELADYRRRAWLALSKFSKDALQFMGAELDHDDMYDKLDELEIEKDARADDNAKAEDNHEDECDKKGTKAHDRTNTSSESTLDKHEEEEEKEKEKEEEEEEEESLVPSTMIPDPKVRILLITDDAEWAKNEMPYIEEAMRRNQVDIIHPTHDEKKTLTLMAQCNIGGVCSNAPLSIWGGSLSITNHISSMCLVCCPHSLCKQRGEPRHLLTTLGR